MKKIFSILSFCMWTLIMSAQTYSTLWKQVEEYQQKDQPQSAIASLRKIQQKAAKEKSYGNLLAAMIKEVNHQAEISEDSMKACKARLLSLQEKWMEQGNGILTVLSGVAMGKKYKVDSLLASSDASVYIKTEKCTEYAPFIDKETDSKYFHNDLLHVIGIEGGDYAALYRYYKSTNDRKAACIAAALMLENSANDVAKVDSLISIYGDLPECGALAKRRLSLMVDGMKSSGVTYTAGDRVRWIDETLKRWSTWKENNELKNERAFLTQPCFNALISRNRINTATPVEITFYDVRNITGLKVMMTSDKGQERYFTLSLPRHEEWELMKDTLKIGLLPLGKWTVTITDSEGKIKSEEQILYVTDLRVIQQAMPVNGDVNSSGSSSSSGSGYCTRYVVVNDITGKPAKGATLLIRKNKNDTLGEKYSVDENGEYLYHSKQNSCIVSAMLGEDTALPEYSVWSSYSYNKQARRRSYLNIYTDRSIYRPGQTVHVAIIRHDILNGSEAKVAEGDTVKVMLNDAQRKQVSEKTLITDEYGTASVDFTLPKEGRTGTYSIQGHGKATSYASISVEEYKRPTFEVTLIKPLDSYTEGDTVKVLGKAKTYSGVAVSNARVTYTVKRQMALWWRRKATSTLLTDTVYTDSEGKFSVRMPMPKIEGHACIFYSIVAEATVMDNSGESHTASLSLPLSNRESYISCDLKDKILADSAVTFTVTRRNAAGNLIEGNVTLTLDGKSIETAKANQKYSLPESLASGEHKLLMICGMDTLEKTFVAFRKSDEAPVTNTKDWFYVSSDRFSSSGSSNGSAGTWMQIGTMDRDVHVVYAVYSADKVLEKGTMRLDGNNITRTFSYRKEYGDGITVSLAWVKDGKMYTHRAFIKKPLADNRLDLQWTSFRNKLLPGQKETWTLRVGTQEHRNSGTLGKKTANTQILAVLYDKSLDALKSHSWSFSDYRSVSVPTTSWRTGSAGRDVFSGYGEIKNLPVSTMHFSYIASDCKLNPYEGITLCGIPAPRMLRSKNTILGVADTQNLVYDCVEQSSLANVKIRGKAIGSYNVEGESEATKELGLRGDFSETAFFMPQLLTDSKGVATLSFTLPESVTTWKFMALSHDKEMRYGSLTDEAVAQKLLMLQAKMPRFLRVGDKGQITANVSNLTDKIQKVNVTLTLMDVRTEKVINSISKEVNITGNGTQPVTFDVTATESMSDGIICKFVAKGKNFSDGEQHLLPILSEQEEKIDTTSFLVEPRKMIMEALPQLAVPTSNNAITLSNALYANVMSAHLKDTLVSAANDNVLVQLLALQNQDGGFSWYSGMQSSVYMTSAVVKTLVRMNKICGVQNNTELMLNKAFSFLEKEMQKEMEWQKQHKTEYLSSTVLDWLYALTLTEKNGGTAEKFFRKMLYQQTVKDNMQTKAVAGIVLNNNHKQNEAKEFAESIKQHTVYRPGMGRYFDSYRAEYSWCDFRIPTQTMCIEALDDITPNDTSTITEMQRWLVQCKRTQRWDNAINAVNAVYALSLNKSQKPFMAAYRVNPDDYKDIIKVSKSLSESQKEGDKVKVTITIVADRDYDFVTVTDNRAACLEPVDQLSGYRFSTFNSQLPNWNDGYYQEMKDNKTVYHFNKLSKGTHTIETEYYIDRAGRYCTGKTTAVCEYAPEFRGSADETKIEVR